MHISGMEVHFLCGMLLPLLTHMLALIPCTGFVQCS